MIILYGGSFNPPTTAHFEISKYLINKYVPQAFIFIPVGDCYRKGELVPFRHRFEMVKILAGKLQNTYVSDYENKSAYEGTMATLDYFQQRNKDQNLYYVIGADNLLTIKKWINHRKLLSNYHFIVLHRHEIDIKKFIGDELNEYRSSFIVEEGLPRLNVSATDYRNLGIDTVVLDEVNKYIYQNQLYNRGDNI